MNLEARKEEVHDTVLEFTMRNNTCDADNIATKDHQDDECFDFAR